MPDVLDYYECDNCKVRSTVKNEVSCPNCGADADKIIEVYEHDQEEIDAEAEVDRQMCEEDNYYGDEGYF